MDTEALDVEYNLSIPDAFLGLMQPHRYKAFYSGRGAAKSHSFASALLAHALEKPTRILCAREIQNSIEESVKQLLEDKIAAYGMQDRFESIKTAIHCDNGSEFMFRGLGKMTAQQLKSIEGVDIVWAEESQTISGRSLEILVPTIRRPGSELWFSWNPEDASDPVDQLFRGSVVPEDALIKRVSWRDNPFFPEVLRREMEFDRLNKPDRAGYIWEGEYQPTAIGAIWNRENLHSNRRYEVPPLERIVVAIDPAIKAPKAGEPRTEDKNVHGIVVVGIGTDQRGYVLEDCSMTGPPHLWGSRAVAAYDEWDADAIVAEVNQGGDMVKYTIQTIRKELRVIEVTATRGKHVRAEPISALYSTNRISHVGSFPDLEGQMCKMTSSGYDGEGSPDRVDALVWGFTELFPSIVTKPTKRVHVEPLGDGGWMA